MRRPSFVAVAGALAFVLAATATACGEDRSDVAPQDGGARGEGGFGDDDGGDAGDDGSLPPQKIGDWDLKPNGEAKITECSRAALTAPASGTCAVTTVGAGTSRVFQGTVLLPDEVLHRGEVVVDANGTITCAACDCSAAAGYADASVVQCANGVISPGLVNPHDHITYANNTPVGHGTERYEHRHDWRKGTHNHTILKYASGASQNVVRFAELRFAMGGVTSIAGSGGERGLVRNVDDSDPSKLEGLPVQSADFDTFPLDDSAGILNTSGCKYGSSRTTSGDIHDLDGYLPHMAEGVDVEARNELLCQSVEDPTNGKYDLVQKQTAIIHGVALTAGDAAELRKNGTSVIWSPRSNVSLYGNTAPVTALDAAGVQIALSTDWIPSGSMNLLRELKCADSLNSQYFAKHFSDWDLWKMVTVNAAFAVGGQNVIGSLKPGYVADISIFDGKTSKDHRAVIDAGVEDVVLVLRGGKVLYGDTALLASPVIGGAACEAIDAGNGDVCGVAKSACVAQDVGGGVTLAGIQAAGEAFYPLFFCKSATPTNEPSCVPYRTEYASGISATDSDGDGVADAKDDCPKIFNPPRLVDNGKQADVDQDGVGDACDRCGTDPKNACTQPDPDDVDGDGVPNTKDDCPDDADASQADSDKDGHGDACDRCPGIANPGASACAVTVKALRDPSDPMHPKPGAIVTIDGVWVTSLKPYPNTGSSRGFFVQSGTDPFSGLAVNTGTVSQGVAVGNKVAVTGVYSESFGITTISLRSLTVEDAGATLPFAPIDVQPSDIATGGTHAKDYECMLVDVQGLTITNDVPDGATSKFYEFVVNNSLRIDDTIYTRYGTPASGNPYPPTSFTNGTTFQKIVGVLGYSFSNSKLWPRLPADIVR